MSYLANLLTGKLLKYSLIDSDIKENYEYAIQVHLEQIIGFSILLTISILFCSNIFSVCKVFVCVFIKKYENEYDYSDYQCFDYIVCGCSKSSKDALECT